MTAQHFLRYLYLTFSGGAALALLPVLLYLWTGWAVRREKLLCYMSEPAALRIYYEQFPWSETSEQDLSVRFRKQFSFLYGRRHFTAPLLLFAFLTLGAFWGICRTAQFASQVIANNHVLPRTAAAALLGAFLWCISDELSRVARRELSPKDVYGWAFRIMLSVPFGFATASVLRDDAGVPVAFFLGAFPTQTLFTIARRLAVQKLGIGDQQSDSGLELQKLQSVSRGVAEAFQDNGIETISALAWADPVDLTIRTNLDFNYVLDCMSQALLWVYFEDRTRDLFRFSLRGSQEVLGLTNAMEGVTLPFDPNQTLTPAQSQAKAALTNVAVALNMSESALLTTLLQVANDPYTRFINEVWH